MEPSKFSAAEPLQAFLQSIDVTTLSADEKLHALYNQMIMLLERITDAFIALDTSWRYVYVNQRAEEILGFPRAELIGKSLWDVFPALLDTHVEQLFRKAMQTQQPIQSEFLSPALHIWLQVHIYPSSNGLSIYLLDITQRKCIEEELEQRSTLAKRFVDSNIIGVLLASEHYIFEANDAFLDLLGYTRADLQAPGINWQSITPPEYHAQDQQMLQQLKDGVHHVTFEKEYYRKDGSRAPVMLGATLYQAQPFQVVCFILDISGRKAIEQRKDDFISITGHELKTPITTIKGYTQLLHKILERQRIQEPLLFLEKMNEQIDTLTRLVNDMLDVSRMHEGKLEFQLAEMEIDTLLHDIVETFQQMKEQPSSATHTIILTGETHERIVGDPNRLRQVFINLINNAIKYSPNANRVELHVEKQHDDIVVSVRDYGIGIPKEHLSHIFDRFYRIYDLQHKGIQGLGIGLYISSELVQRHGGKIWVESEVGKGTTFYVSLPPIYKRQLQMPPGV